MAKRPRIPTDAEEAAINRGIAQDPDNPELDDDFFANARPAAEALPKSVYAEHIRRRGPGKRPPKVQVTLRVEQDVLDRLRATGRGWQIRANEALRSLVDLSSAKVATPTHAKGRK